MFQVSAASVEEYFRFDPAREDALRELDAVIRGTAPGLSRWFVPGTPLGQPGMTMTMIGYGQYTYGPGVRPARSPRSDQPCVDACHASPAPSAPASRVSGLAERIDHP